MDPIDQTDTARNTAEVWDILNKSGTPYGDLTVVDRDNRIDVTSESPLSDQIDFFTSGVSHDPINSRYRLRANDSTESLQTIDDLQYTPGYIAEVGISLQIPEAPTGNQEVRFGYFDSDDGVYFGWDSDGVFVERLRNGSRIGKTYREDWTAGENVNVEQQLHNGTIALIELALYNYGTIGFDIYDQDRVTNGLQANKVHNADVPGTTTLSSQDNPIRVEVSNPDTSDFDVFVADRQATVRGNFTPNRRIKGERRTDVSLDGTTYVPIISFRRKESFKTINTDLFDLAAKPDEDIYIQIREDAGSTTDADYATPQDVNADETAVEVDTSPTASITDGYYVFQGQFDGGERNRSVLGRLDNVDVALKNTRPMTVYARTVSATDGNLTAFNLNWAENW